MQDNITHIAFYSNLHQSAKCSLSGFEPPGRRTHPTSRLIVQKAYIALARSITAVPVPPAFRECVCMCVREREKEGEEREMCKIQYIPHDASKVQIHVSICSHLLSGETGQCKGSSAVFVAKLHSLHRNAQKYQCGCLDANNILHKLTLQF